MGTATVRGAPASRRAPLASPDAESDDSQRQPVPATVETLLVLDSALAHPPERRRLERLEEGLTVVGGRGPARLESGGPGAIGALG